MPSINSLKFTSTFAGAYYAAVMLTFVCCFIQATVIILILL